MTLVEQAATLHQKYLTEGVYEEDLRNCLDRLLRQYVADSNRGASGVEDLAQYAILLNKDLAHHIEGYILRRETPNMRLHYAMESTLVQEGSSTLPPTNLPTITAKLELIPNAV